MDSCPKCGATDNYKKVIQFRESFNLLAFLAGDIFAVICLNAARKKRVQCNYCRAFFYIRTPSSKISLVLFWLLVFPAIATIFILLVILAYTFFSH
jgi:hypothetical protein